MYFYVVDSTQSNKYPVVHQIRQIEIKTSHQKTFDLLSLGSTQGIEIHYVMDKNCYISYI